MKNRSESAAHEEFLQRYPVYTSTQRLEDMRASEYGRLDRERHVYLDYTGGGLYAESQIRRHAELLHGNVFGNPHSASPSSGASTRLIEETRRAVLAWFNAAPDQYTAVFTANATSALKLVGEAYPFGAGRQYLMTADNHNSVNGIREFASRKRASVAYAPLSAPDLRVEKDALTALLEANRVDRSSTSETGSLFAFPAQSNFSGVRHPLDLVEQAHDLGWDVLLDAAAFAPTNSLNLSEVRADFVCISFYKMFGYPTGVGCLLIRKTMLAKLKRPWFAGGTVNFATVQGRRHILAPGEAGFEDGTLNYLSIPAVRIGLAQMESAGVDTIHTRVECLTGWLLRQLMDLRHSNGRPLVRIYGPADTVSRGATVTMNFYDPEGHLLDYRRVEELAGERNISLRTGCFCNPGAGETAEGLTEDEMVAAAESGTAMTLPRFLQFITHRGGKGAGAIRVSFGIASNFADAYAFVKFASGFRDQTQMTIGKVTFDIEACRVIRDGS